MKPSFIKSAAFVAFAACSFISHGQNQALNSGLAIPINQATENASSLTRSGNIPVNFSSGQPIINIPLHATSYSGIPVGIKLNYDASGVRVDQHPTWVGLGWNLQTGGVITRNVKGMPDDYVFPDNNGTHFANTEKGYLFCGGKLNTPNWNTPQALSLFAAYFSPNSSWNPDYLADGMPDDYNFQFGNYSGTLFLDEQGIWRIKSQTNLGLEVTHEVNDQPVIFETNANNSSRIEINKMITKFTIIAPDGMKYVFGGNLNAIDYSRGGNDNFIMFHDVANTYNISPTAWYLTEIVSPQGPSVKYSYERGQVIIKYYRSVQTSIISTNYSNSINANVIALGASILTPCYLRKIETPLQTITFNRSRATQQIFEGISWRNPTDNYEYPLSAFDKQLWWAAPQYAYYREWPDFFWHAFDWLPTGSQRIPDFSQKLDSIVIADRAANTYKTVIFGYNNVSSERLFLNSLTVRGSDGLTDENYNFDYYRKSRVPNYSSLQKDQWGYYNGQGYVTTSGMFDNSVWRLPNVDSAIVGSLKSIQYPTGGKTTFEFELNNYAQFQKVTFNSPLGGTGSVSLESTGGNVAAGGLRIKKITSSSGYNAPDVVKTYFYNKNSIGGGNTSSGIIAGKNRYVEQCQFVNFCAPGGTRMSLFSDNEFNPYGEDQKAVSYGEVTEVNGDGSKTVYRYSNYDDPGCMDEMDNNSFLYNVMESDLYKLTSNSLERGLLLSETNYNSGNQKVSEKIYEYEYAPDRKQKFAKGIQRFDKLKETVRATLYGMSEVCNDYFVYRLYCYKKYYYNLPLKKITENVYSGSNTVSSSVSYSYDSYGNITTTASVGSDGKKTTASTRYNSHPDYLVNASSADAIGLNRLFTTFRIKNAPVEQTTVVSPSDGVVSITDNYLTAASLYKYNQNFPFVEQTYQMELQQPFYLVTWNGSSFVYNYTASSINSSGNFVYDSRYKLQSAITAYSINLNMVQGRPFAASKVSGNETYTWDYRSQYLTSVTKNATLPHTAYTSFEGQYQIAFPSVSDDNMGNWIFNKNSIVNGGIGGIMCLSLPTGTGENIKSAANLQNGKQYVISFWYKGDFPQLKNGNTMFGSMYPYTDQWKYVEFPFTGNGGQVSIIAPVTSTSIRPLSIDEVRLYPSDARMKTYTFDFMTGVITSEGYENGDLRLYRYDRMGRLLEIRDSKNNILKKYTYQYQGPQ